MLENAHYILGDRPFEPDEKAAKNLDADARDMLARLTSRLQHDSRWSSEFLEESVRSFAENEGLKLGRVAQPLRAALTGRAISPGVFDVMITLGREECLARLDDASRRSDPAGEN